MNNTNVCNKMDDGSQIRSIRIADDGGVFVELMDGRIWYAPKESVPMLRDLLEEEEVHGKSLKELVPAKHPDEEQAAREQVPEPIIIPPGSFIFII